MSHPDSNTNDQTGKITDQSDPNTDSETSFDEDQMPLVAHLTELRKRLLSCFLAILLIFLGLFYFANDIYTFVSKPLQDLMPEGTTMIATEVASPFLTPFKLTLVTAIFLAMPVILFQLWGFISPGMYQHEKRIAAPVLFSSIALFYGGVAFAYFVVFPLIFSFFTHIGPEGVAIMTDINRYLDFVLKLFFAFGFAFEIPIAIILMVWTGISTPQSLAEKRPYVVIGCFVAGMLLTPPDIMSQTLLALPMWLLFELGLLFGKLIKRTR